MMNTKYTHEPIGDDFKPQGNCSHCGRRPRLNVGLVTEWLTREDACMTAENFNAQTLAVSLSQGSNEIEETGEQKSEVLSQVSNGIEENNEQTSEA